MTSSKRCFKCKETKPLDDFYRHPKMADGRVNKCKECNKLDVKKNRASKVDYYRKYDLERAKLPDRAKAAAEISKRWRSQDARIMAAHNAVSRAVRSGRLKREPCERCGAEKSYGHHEDYNKKLEVMWLCQPCHKQRHKELAILEIDPLDRDSP